MTEVSTRTSDSPIIVGDNSDRWRVRIALVLILALAAFLRFHTLTERGFFFDELWIVELSNGHGTEFMQIPINQVVDQPNTVQLAQARSLWQVPTHMTGAIHPPGTFMMLRLWREVIGDSMYALRSFSATWSVLVVLLTFFAARLSFGTAAGLWAALLSALSFANIDQAQDVRGYTMLQAELLLTAVVLLKSRGKEQSWPRAIASALGIGAGTLAMMYSHYFAAGACAAIAFGAITLLRGRTRWLALAAIGLGGVIWVVTWLPQLRAQLAYVPETADGFLIDKTGDPLLSTMLRLVASPYQALVADPTTLYRVPIAGGAIVALFLLFGRRRRDPDATRVGRLWLAIAVGLIGTLLVLDLARQTAHLEHVKYLSPANPALCVLLASAFIWRRRLVPALASVGLAVALFTTPLPFKTDDRIQMAWLREHVGPDDLVILPSFNALGRDGQVMYLFLAYGVPHAHQKIAIPVQQMSPSFIDTLPRAGRWFYWAFDYDYDPVKWLPGCEVVEKGPVGMTAVYEIRRRASAGTQPATTASSPR